jgi:excisionase family DNA binding protein
MSHLEEMMNKKLFRRGPIVWRTFKLDNSAQPVNEVNASLTERIEHAGHALTAKDLAHLLNVSAITLFKHCKAGRIPCFRIGTSVRFEPIAVARWLKGKLNV